MNDSPVVSEPTPRAAGVPHRTLLRWRAHGAETAAVAIGTAAVAVQSVRLGPWFTDDAAVAVATGAGGTGAGAAGGGVPGRAADPWQALLALGPRSGFADAGGWYATALALLCFAGALYAATATLRALRGRRAWPYALGAAGAVTMCPPALAWLFAGTGEVFGLLVIASLARTIACASARGLLPHARTAVGAGLLAGLGAFTLPAGLALAAAYPAALLFAGRRRGGPAPALRGFLLYTVTITPVGWWISAEAVGSGPATTGAVLLGAVLLGAVLLGAGAAAGAGASAPVRLTGLLLGTVLLLAGEGLPPGLALALCGTVLLTGRGRHARGVGGAALAAGTGLLWAGAGWAALPAGVAIGVLFPGPWPTRNRGAEGPSSPPRRCAATTTAPGGAQPAPTRARAIRRAVTARTARTARTTVVGVAVGAGLVAGPAQGAGTSPRDDTLCFTQARYGHLFAAYADRLGLRRSTVALASPGGVLLLGEQRAVDLRGRTDPRIAAAREAHDDAALRHHLFVRLRPEFVHVDAEEAARTGLSAERLAAHGYRPLLRQGAGGDFVHRSAVTAPERLPELRRWARGVVADLSAGPPGGPGASPVRQGSGDREPAGPVGHGAEIRPGEQTCHR